MQWQQLRERKGSQDRYRSADASACTCVCACAYACASGIRHFAREVMAMAAWLWCEGIKKALKPLLGLGLVASLSLSVSAVLVPSVAQADAPNLANVTIGGRSNPDVERILPDFTMNYDRNTQVVSLQRKDGSGRAFVQIMPAASHLSTTKAYAQNVMDSYAGWGLTARIERRGFSFQYVDNAPCAGLLTYFDGTSYLLFGSCGLISQEELTKAFSLAKLQLGLDNITYRSSQPSAYY